MGHTILDRHSSVFSSAKTLTHNQSLQDNLLATLSDEVRNPLGIAAMVSGGLVFKSSNLLLSKLASPLLTESGFVTQALTQGAIRSTSLFAEVAAFRSVSHQSLNIFQKEEFFTDMLTFGTLKGVGKLAHGQNIALTHFLQAGGMVTAQNMAYRLGLNTQPQGTLLQQFVHAEATNVKLGLAMSLMGVAAPKIVHLERALDLQNEIVGANPGVRPGRHTGLPLHVQNLLSMSTVENIAPTGVELKPTDVSERSFNMWGRKLFEASKSSWLSPSTWRSPFRLVQDRILNEILKDEGSKKRMIAFLDVVTNAPDHLLLELLHDYFPEGGQNSKGLLRHALNLGISSWVPAPLIIWGIRFSLNGMAKRFLAGESTQAALVQARQWREKGIQATLDVVQENVVSVREADHYTTTVVDLIREWRKEKGVEARTKGGVPVRHVSVKLSGLSNRFDPLAHDWVAKDVQTRLLKIFKEAKESSDAGMPVMVNVDLEDYAVRDLSYDILWNTLNHADLAGWQDAAVVVQAYYKESANTLRLVLDNAEKYKKRIQIRIVKGAYHSFEQIRSGRNDWEVPVFLTQAETDQSFKALADMALQRHDVIRLAIGSHNLEDIAYVQARREELGIGIHEVEHQFLRGVGNHLAQAVIRFEIPARFYGPFGSKANGLGYMVRRLDEVKITSAIGETHSAGSWAAYRARRKRTDPPLTSKTDPVFRNTPEADFSKASVRQAMHDALTNLKKRFPLPITPLLGNDKTYNRHREASQLNVNPGNWRESVSEIWNSTPDDVTWALECAQLGHREWSAFTQNDRSQTLNHAADIVYERRYEIAAHLVTEAGKPWHMALAEVHEGIDFLRAYALDALEVSERKEALGVGVAIAPFNFPFAIALGEMAGGLSIGNAMILKPSEQTPAVGKLLVEILREAGVPPDAAQFLPGSGKEVGQALVESPDVDFVVFTGSKGSAENIMEAARLHPSARHGYKVVVAETGGKNAMIVDKTADLDVAVKAILDGAFMMSGQRCSATSRVFVDTSIADALMTRLVEGAQSMIVGDPLHPETQIGPQIDQRAYDKVMRYLRLGKDWGKAHDPHYHSSEIGHYMGPWIFEGGDPKGRFAQEEIFGPALAVMRVKNLDEAIRLANDSPYGLTAGLISRSPRNIRTFLEKIKAGNAYVNRSQVGAMVWRQPFGGLDDSGTGPKAGGRQYVARFAKAKNRKDEKTEIAFSETPEVTHFFDRSFFSGNDERWRQTPASERIAFVQAAIHFIQQQDLSSTYNRKSLIQRLRAYAQQAEHLIHPQTTLPVPGEINEELHDWSYGTGIIWADKNSTHTFISDVFAALLMGNSVLLPSNPHSTFVMNLLQRISFNRYGSWNIPVFISSLPPSAILNDSHFSFVVAQGPQAQNVFAHFLPKTPRAVGFRRSIGGFMDDPDDPLYLTRFASARTRTEETLRHGAELNLR